MILSHFSSLCYRLSRTWVARCSQRELCLTLAFPRDSIVFFAKGCQLLLCAVTATSTIGSPYQHLLNQEERVAAVVYKVQKVSY